MTNKNVWSSAKLHTTERGWLGRTGMTQREVAEVMGISYQMVQQIERSAMLKLQVALGVVKQTRIPGKGRPRYHYERVETPVAQEMREAVQEHCRK